MQVLTHACSPDKKLPCTSQFPRHLQCSNHALTCCACCGLLVPSQPLQNLARLVICLQRTHMSRASRDRLAPQVIVFSDNIFCLREYATRLRKPFIYGATSHAERTQVLHAFKHKPEVGTLCPPSFGCIMQGLLG